jgi:hypothetical protein
MHFAEVFFPYSPHPKPLSLRVYGTTLFGNIMAFSRRGAQLCAPT